MPKKLESCVSKVGAKLKKPGAAWTICKRQMGIPLGKGHHTARRTRRKNPTGYH